MGKGSDKLIPSLSKTGKLSGSASSHSEHYGKLQERGHPLPGAKEPHILVGRGGLRGLVGHQR